MEKCDNKSVGVIVENEHNEILLIGRARFPFGLAGIAGHVDEHGSLEQTAVDEVWEESGVKISVDGLVKVIDNVRIDNHCRRPGGDHHYWTVFKALTEEQELIDNPAEVLNAQWMPREDLARIALKQQDEIRSGDQILEPVWRQFFTEAGIV